MSRPGGWWRRKSTPAKVETYTRWSFHFFGFIEVTTVGSLMFGDMGAFLGGWVFLAVCAHAVLSAVTASRALDWVRDRRERPVRLLGALIAATVLLGAGALVLTSQGPGSDAAESAGGALFVSVLAFGAGTLSLGFRGRRRVLAVVAGFGAGAGTVSLLIGLPWVVALAMATAALVSSGFLAFTSVFSVWLLNAVYALDEARETRARLAVAEERLRFGRDLHDVIGRNLAVISLKSELAVQLARRGKPEAVDQMTEVQRIAGESQREVREVVRGYREADLEVELTGARGVLEAAGIECALSGSAGGLPGQVQSALGWVVREATTNVLRHGNAAHCTVSLRTADGSVLLTVENDGAPGPAGTAPETGRGPGLASEPGRGSGLAGLRERLTQVDGVLRAGPAEDGRFRLTAEVPLPAGAPADAAPARLPLPVPHPATEVTP
ncbi:histidine kinase [Streptomyces sp. NPDC008313]|uniref:histidine kinase n=1 Tax=Streptomyces sp. NPDC008313 TaxID=3364826 RepID=UPI0036F0A2DA